MKKTMETIYREMLEVFREASGYLPSPSCDLAVRLSAAAAQLESLYHEAQWVLDQSFPQTAQGEYLDRHALLRGITRAEATRATGLLRFGLRAPVEQSVTVKAGTVCMTKEGVRFRTLEEGKILPGSLYTDVAAEASEPGKAGNTAAGTVTIMAAMPVGVQGCTNPAAFSGGDDREDDEALRKRLLDNYRRLPNGANAAYYEHTALSFPGVSAATAIGRPRGVGSVDVYVSTKSGAPEEALLQEIDSYLQEKREISVDLRTLSPQALPVDVRAQVRSAPGYTLEETREQVDAALREAFTGKLLGQSVTRAFLGNLLYDLPSVENYRLLSPAEDTVPDPRVLPVLGAVDVGEMEE